MNIEPLNVITTAEQLKSQKGVKRIILAYCYSVAGLKVAFQKETAFRQLLLLNLLLLPLAFMLDVSHIERAVMIAVLLLALIVELLNSAIEATVDRISLELHPLSKQAKDMGSAAQLVVLALVAMVWSVILV